MHVHRPGICSAEKFATISKRVAEDPRLSIRRLSQVLGL